MIVFDISARKWLVIAIRIAVVYIIKLSVCVCIGRAEDNRDSGIFDNVYCF